MNLSGSAVRYWLTKLKIDVKNLLIVTDDLNLEVGNIRMKKNGSDGGHNGLKDIQQTLSSNQYPRLRIGVGNNFPKGKQIDYVLGEWTKEEDLVLNQKMKIINEMVLSFCFAGIENTMNAFNNK
jgi:PTH1 family peptidyl-tRNA hydrolase